MRYSFYIICLFIMAACSVVEEDRGDSSGTQTISFENIYPESIIDANAYLLGGASRTWSTVAFTIEGISGFQNCRLDDEITLMDDNTYRYDGGTMLCGAEDNQKIKTGSWDFDEGSRTLTFDRGTTRESVFYIESLTAGEIVVSSYYYNYEVVGKFADE